ncbi:MAG: kinase/pyrophosphorylase [Alphaproteobacteria bacterium]|nr:kinase/pyrophosphorylase [Alphaproteobacteria bacterium]
MRLHMHLVSDSTGDTVTTVARAGISQFDGVVPVEHVWSFVRSRAQVEQVLSMVKALPGVVIYTMVSPDLRQVLEEGCRELQVPVVPILDGVFKALSRLLGAETRQQIGRQHAMDDGYFSRIEAMDFMLQHDDGQSPWDLNAADIVLVGVSRASKTPTCIYLANRGLKTANVPVVLDCPLPKELDSLDKPLVVGLTITPEPLVQIRSNRLKQMERGSTPMRLADDYTELERVRAELVYARRLFARYDWPVIDVTRRSVEETAAAVFQLFQGRVGRAARAAGETPPA